jgi:hypothetical protein
MVLNKNGTEDIFEAAYEKVCRYTQRWKIERFRYVLKSGYETEKLRERTMDRTAVLVLMCSIIAAVIMNLACLALLYRAVNKTKKTPVKPYVIEEAVSCLGRLGGPKRAPGDGPPGVKTI